MDRKEPAIPVNDPGGVEGQKDVQLHHPALVSREFEPRIPFPTDHVPGIEGLRIPAGMGVESVEVFQTLIDVVFLRKDGTRVRREREVHGILFRRRTGDRDPKSDEEDEGNDLHGIILTALPFRQWRFVFFSNWSLSVVFVVTEKSIKELKDLHTVFPCDNTFCPRIGGRIRSPVHSVWKNFGETS